MAGREELVDAIAGFALFADLTTPQLEGIVHTFDEAVFGEGERILRQGISGSGFHVILDGEAAIVVDGTERARLGRGEFFGEVSILLGETPIADVVATRPMRCLVLAASRRSRRSSSPIPGSCTGCSRRRRAGCGPRTDGGADPPVPARRPIRSSSSAADPAGSRSRTRSAASACATRSSPPTRRRAGCSGAGRSSSGCCRGPSRTPRSRAGRARTSATTGTACSARSPGPAAIAPTLMDGTSVLPVAPGDGGEPRDVRRAGRARGPLRLPPWTATRLLDGPGGRDRFDLETVRRRRTRCATLVLAVGVAEPYTPPGPGWSTPTTTPTSDRPRRTRSGGCSSSASRTPGSSWPTACSSGRSRIVLVSPSPAKLSVDTNSLVGVRARYVQPYEDHVLGGGVSILDAAIDRVERARGRRAGREPAADRRRRGPPRRGRRRHLGDRLRGAAAATCRRSGVTTFGASALPVVSPWWESTSVPGIFVAGTLGQAAKGLQRHGLPANSGAVHGARYNARVLARPHRADAVRHRAAAAGDRPGRRRRLAGDRARGGPRALPPARLPRAAADRGSGRQPARRRGPAAGPPPRHRRTGRGGHHPRGGR